LPDHVAADGELRLQRLAFEAFQKYLRQDRATQAAGFGDADRVAGICFVAADP